VLCQTKKTTGLLVFANGGPEQVAEVATQQNGFSHWSIKTMTVKVARQELDGTFPRLPQSTTRESIPGSNSARKRRATFTTILLKEPDSTMIAVDGFKQSK
jgi:hypothetical protein